MFFLTFCPHGTVMGCEVSGSPKSGDGDPLLCFQLLNLIQWCHRVAFELGELALPHNERKMRGQIGREERSVQGKKMKFIQILTAPVCLCGSYCLLALLSHTD